MCVYALLYFFVCGIDFLFFFQEQAQRSFAESLLSYY